MELYKNQNIEPTAVLKKINKSYNVNFKTPGMKEDFFENYALRNFIKSQDMFPYLTIENETENINCHVCMESEVTESSDFECQTENCHFQMGHDVSSTFSHKCWARW